ncbi:MAG: HEAT repeat domain-containing protein [Planctomycetota bacterium]
MRTLYVSPVLVAMALVVRVDAQEKQGAKHGAVELEKAILIEESENDLAHALELYLAIAKAPDTANEVRTRAWLQMGLCLQKLGRDDEAGEALQLASQGEGEAAQKARAILGGTAQGGERLAGQVRLLVDTLLNNPGTAAATAASKELIWVGEAAVPLLLENIDWDAYSLPAVRALISTILAIGGADAAAFVREIAASPELILKRAVIKAIQESEDPIGFSEPLRSALEAFVHDPDPRVRREFIEAKGRILSLPTIIALTADREPAIAQQAWYLVRSSWLANTEQLELLEPSLRRALQSSNEDVKRAARGVVSGSALLKTEPGRRLYLELLQKETLPAKPEKEDWPLRGFFEGPGITFDGKAKVTSFEPAPSPEEVLAAARKIPDLAEIDGSTHGNRRRAMALFAAASATGWNHDAMPVVLELVTLGFDQGKLGDWVMRQALPADLMAILRVRDKFAVNKDFVRWLIQQQLSSEAFEPLREWLEEAIPGKSPLAETVPLLEWVLGALKRLQTPQCADYLVDLARRYPDSMYSDLAGALLQWPPEVATPALVDLVAVPGGGENAGRARNEILVHFARAGLTDVLANIPKAYEAGVMKSTNERYLEWLLTAASSGYEGMGLRYTAPTVAGIAEDLLRAGSATAWEDIVQARGRFEKLPAVVLDAVRRHVLDLPGAPRKKLLEQFLRGTPTPEMSHLFARALMSEDKEIVRTAVGAGIVPPEEAIPRLRELLADPDPDVIDGAACRLVATGKPEVLSWLMPLLAHQESGVRAAIAPVIARLAPDQTFELLSPLMGDPDSYVRSSVCRIFENRLDTRAMPLLLKALEDPSSDVRDAASSALRAIRTHQENVSKWKTWVEKAGLQDETPIAALIRQSGKENPREIRMAAITSLATLGNAEVLPILIEFMRDPDREVAAAAQRSVYEFKERALPREEK